jgi:hypothetical protein
MKFRRLVLIIVMCGIFLSSTGCPLFEYMYRQRVRWEEEIKREKARKRNEAYQKQIEEQQRERERKKEQERMAKEMQERAIAEARARERQAELERWERIRKQQEKENQEREEANRIRLEEEKRQEECRLEEQRLKEQQEREAAAAIEKQHQEERLLEKFNRDCLERLEAFKPQDQQQANLKNRIMEMRSLNNNLDSKRNETEMVIIRIGAMIKDWKDKVKEISNTRNYQSFEAAQKDTAVTHRLEQIRENSRRVKGLEDYVKLLKTGREEVILAERRSCDQFIFIFTIGPREVNKLLMSLNDVLERNASLIERRDAVIAHKADELKQIWQQIMK